MAISVVQAPGLSLMVGTCFIPEDLAINRGVSKTFHKQFNDAALWEASAKQHGFTAKSEDDRKEFIEKYRMLKKVNVVFLQELKLPADLKTKYPIHIHREIVAQIEKQSNNILPVLMSLSKRILASHSTTEVEAFAVVTLMRNYKNSSLLFRVIDTEEMDQVTLIHFEIFQECLGFISQNIDKEENQQYLHRRLLTTIDKNQPDIAEAILKIYQPTEAHAAHAMKTYKLAPDEKAKKNRKRILDLLFKHATETNKQMINRVIKSMKDINYHSSGSISDLLPANFRFSF